jgi:hypothetical protein
MREEARMVEQRERERYAELMLLLEGTAATRSMLEGLLEDGGETVDATDVETALEPLRAIGRVPPGGAVIGGRGAPLSSIGPRDAEPELQEFRSGAQIVDFSGEERDDLDRVVGALVAVELEDPEEPGFELVRFHRGGELVAYHAEWAIATVPGGLGILARLDLEFRRPSRFSTRLLFDVASHQWALRAMELTGNCLFTIRVGEVQQDEYRVRVRAPRSAQLASALTVVRTLDDLMAVYEEV